MLRLRRRSIHGRRQVGLFSFFFFNVNIAVACSTDVLFKCYFLPETDYYNYYYGGYYQSGTETTAEAQENVVMETQGYCEPTEEHHVTAETAPANPEPPNESSDFPQTEV